MPSLGGFPPRADNCARKFRGREADEFNIYSLITRRGRASRPPSPSFTTSLERDPNTVAPIAAAVPVAAPMAIAVVIPVMMTVPIVIVEAHTQTKWEPIAVVRAPAIAVSVADDVGGGARRRGGQSASSQQQRQSSLGANLADVSH